MFDESLYIITGMSNAKYIINNNHKYKYIIIPTNQVYLSLEQDALL